LRRRTGAGADEAAAVVVGQRLLLGVLGPVVVVAVAEGELGVEGEGFKGLGFLGFL